MERKSTDFIFRLPRFWVRACHEFTLCLWASPFWALLSSNGRKKKQLGTLNGSFFLEYSINVVILASLEFYMISCQFCNFLTL